MVLMIVAYLLTYLRVAAWLHYMVLPTVVGAIKSSPMLTLLITMMVIMAGVLAVISKIVNPSHPPFRVALLFRQVRIALGLTAYITEIELNETTEMIRKVYNLLPMNITGSNVF